MTAELNRYLPLASYARDNPVVFTLVKGMSLEDLLSRLSVRSRDFAPIPPTGEVEFDFDKGRIVGLLADGPDGWLAVSEQASRFDGIDFVESAPRDVQAICVAYFHNGLFEFVDAGRVTRYFELCVYDGNGALPEERDLPLNDPSAGIPALMALVERLTGVVTEHSWFTGPFPYVWEANS